MKIAIVTIGDEILIGQIVDTNSAWMAKQLTAKGFEVIVMLSIADDAQQIKDTIDTTLQHADVVLLTGGLGPTKDDITKATLCDYFGTSLVYDEDVAENIKEVLHNRMVINDLTASQAYIPQGCTVIQNRVGTAPITWFDYQDKVLVSMPGVPYEMKYAMENEVIPRLEAKYATEAYVNAVFVIGGYSESALAIHLTDFENNLPPNFGLAYLPSPGLIRLRLFVWGKHRKAELDIQVQLLKSTLGNAIWAEEDIPLEKIVGECFVRNQLSLGTAESCTGGYIAHLISSISGASAYFKGGIVSYANDIKENVLHVSPDNLTQYGAVSESVVVEMAQGACKLLHVDSVIAVSGIAGPNGGTKDKPVGTLWVCTIYKGKQEVKNYLLGKHREANIVRASNIAMLQLLQMMD